MANPRFKSADQERPHESVTCRSLGASIDQNISQPLGLHNTTFPTDTAMPPPFTRGYLAQPLGPARDVTVNNPGVAGGAGAMTSNLGDLKRWSKALATGELISPRLHRRQLQFKPLVNGKITLGYGLGISNLNGSIGHNGGILGYSTAMFYLPGRDATIVVEANQDNVDAVVATALFVSRTSISSNSPRASERATAPTSSLESF